MARISSFLLVCAVFRHANILSDVFISPYLASSFTNPLICPLPRKCPFLISNDLLLLTIEQIPGLGKCHSFPCTAAAILWIGLEVLTGIDLTEFGEHFTHSLILTPRGWSPSAANLPASWVPRSMLELNSPRASGPVAKIRPRCSHSLRVAQFLP